jgi:hypothetical protein
MEPLTYRPIEASSEIRLLVFEDFEGPLSNEAKWKLIEGISPDAAEDFAAVSYVWGDPNKTSTFTIDGKSLEVPVNLGEFLQELPRHIRRKEPSLPKRFWIDSICIDQDNDEEKPHQIRLLRTIYRDATCVLSWLGPAEESSIELSERKISVDPALDYLSIEETSYRKSKIQHYPHRSLKALVESLEALLNRPYWHRIWIVQEVLLARDIWIFCGTRILNWNELFSFFFSNDPILAHKHITLSRSYAFNLVKERQAYKRMMRAILVDQGVRTLRDLLHVFFIYQSTVPTDKICGLLALCPGRNEAIVDYTVSCSKSYGTIHRFLTSKSGSTTEQRSLLVRRLLALDLAGVNHEVETDPLFLESIHSDLISAIRMYVMRRSFLCEEVIRLEYPGERSTFSSAQEYRKFVSRLLGMTVDDDPKLVDRDGLPLSREQVSLPRPVYSNFKRRTPVVPYHTPESEHKPPSPEDRPFGSSRPLPFSQLDDDQQCKVAALDRRDPTMPVDDSLQNIMGRADLEKEQLFFDFRTKHRPFGEYDLRRQLSLCELKDDNISVADTIDRCHSAHRREAYLNFSLLADDKCPGADPDESWESASAAGAYGYPVKDTTARGDSLKRSLGFNNEYRETRRESFRPSYLAVLESTEEEEKSAK